MTQHVQRARVVGELQQQRHTVQEGRIEHHCGTQLLRPLVGFRQDEERRARAEQRCVEEEGVGGTLVQRVDRRERREVQEASEFLEVGGQNEGVVLRLLGEDEGQNRCD